MEAVRTSDVLSSPPLAMQAKAMAAASASEAESRMLAALEQMDRTSVVCAQLLTVHHMSQSLMTSHSFAVSEEVHFRFQMGA